MNEIIYLPQDIKKQWELLGGLKPLQSFLRDGIELIRLYCQFNLNVNEYLEKRSDLKQLLNISEQKIGTNISHSLLKEIGELFAACVGAITPDEFEQIKEAYPNAINFVEKI